jgi:hypothetical protein
MRSLWRMERKFANNCSVCHLGNNIIIPEKNLKTLEANGMNTIISISYQVINEKWDACIWWTIN